MKLPLPGREGVLPRAACPITLASGLDVVIGSAWRWTIFEDFPSRRKISGTRNAYGTSCLLPSTRACPRSIRTNCTA